MTTEYQKAISQPIKVSRKRGIQEKVLVTLHENIGLHMTTGEVVSRTGYSREQVSGALSHLSQRGLIRRVGSGVYVHDASEPSPNRVPNDTDADQPGSNLFESVGRLERGDTIVRGEDDILYILSPLDSLITST